MTYIDTDTDIDIDIDISHVILPTTLWIDNLHFASEESLRNPIIITNIYWPENRWQNIFDAFSCIISFYSYEIFSVDSFFLLIHLHQSNAQNYSSSTSIQPDPDCHIAAQAMYNEEKKEIRKGRRW